MTGVYIAGPMRNRPAYNFEAFQQADVEVRKFFGHKADALQIFNPALNDIERKGLEDLAETEGWAACGQWLLDNPQDFSLREALEDDLSWIARNATDIVFLPGWQDSAGARAEKALADAIGVTPWFLDPEHGVVPLMAQDLSRSETRTTSSTGGMKGVKPEQYQSIPVRALRELAEHYAKGAAKYEDHNFRKGYEWSKSYSALLRHLLAFWEGEDIDPETGSKHVTAVAWHALALSTFMDEHPEFDDRYVPPTTESGD